MHSGHSYAVQSAALYVAMIPFIALFTILAGARFFEGVRRARKPAPQRPVFVSPRPIAAPRRFVAAVD